MFKKKRKGNILTENIIFIVLNLVFLSILLLFLFTKTGSAALLEEKYAKQIALALDAAEPGMTISLDMEDAMKIADTEKISRDDVVNIEGNLVTVKLREDGGYSYSFFNDLEFKEGNSGYYLNTTGRNEFIFYIR